MTRRTPVKCKARLDPFNVKLTYLYGNRSIGHKALAGFSLLETPKVLMAIWSTSLRKMLTIL